MSILIRGLDMPNKKNGAVLIIYPNGDAVFDDGYHYKAVPVPEQHGDLIERKAACLTDFEIAMCDGDYKDGMKMLLEKIESAPTIIPASGEGEP